MSWMETWARSVVLGWLFCAVFVVCLLIGFFVEENRSFTAQDRANAARTEASIQTAIARDRKAEAQQKEYYQEYLRTGRM